MDRSRSVLFGYVAVQRSIVTLPQMLEAHSTWSQQSGESLDRVLLERGYITQEQYSAIEKEVESCWQSYHGEFATIAKESSEREHAEPGLSDTLTVPNSTVDAGRSGVESQEGKDALVSATIDYAISQPDTLYRGEKKRMAGNRYRIIRPHARGGLGEVSLAEDKELRRQVALKEIQARFAQDRDSKTRFIQEAEVTGRLEHPGIVPVYGFGEFADGRPYYAMRFIEGESLKDAADAWHRIYKAAALPNPAEPASNSASAAIDYFGLEFRGLLGRLIDVAQAIEYAHSRGVLHRDLKPSNIMLGKYGETLVVDWGLAKVRDLPDLEQKGLSMAAIDQAGPAAAMSMTGAALGTPSFMPPEQASGDWEKVGPASDVYALGSTLYYLLTGQSPVKADSLRELLEKVIRGEVVPPSRLCSTIPKPLEAICLKAMALKPEERYLSPQDFAADLERFLADEATTAYVEPSWMRAKRWARKHPKSIASITATIMAGLISAIAIAVIVNQKNEQLNQSLVRETQLKTEAIDAQTRAERNQEVAENQSRLALNTLTSMVYDLQGGLEDIPGGAEIRRRLLMTSLEKLGEVAEQYVEKSVVDINSYQALTDMGDVVLRFGIGDSPFSEALDAESKGEEKSLLKVAGSFFERALQIAEQLFTEKPEGVGSRQRLVIALDNVGKVRWQQGDTSAAVALLERSHRLAEEHVKAQPDDYRGLNTLGITLERLHVIYSSLGEPSKSYAALQRKLEIDLKLTQQQPNEMKLHRDLSLTYAKLAAHYSSENELEKADEYSRLALQACEQLLQWQPESVMAKADLASQLLAHGDLLESQFKSEEARRLFERSQGLLEELIVEDPANLVIKRKLVKLNRAFGDLEKNQMRLSEALKYALARVQLQREVAAANRDDLKAQEELVLALESTSDVYLQLDDLEFAREMVKEQIGVVDELLAQSPEDLAVRIIWVGGYLSGARSLLAARDFETAEGYLRDAKQAIDRLREEDSTNREILRISAKIEKEWARLFSSTGRLGDAQASIAVATRIYEQLDDNQGELGLFLEQAANILMEQQDFVGAEKVLLRKLEGDESWLSRQSQVFHHRHNQTVTFFALAGVYLNLGQREKCIEMLERTLSSRRELAEQQPSYWRTLAKTCNAVGETYWQLGELTTAQSLMSEGLKLIEEKGGAGSFSDPLTLVTGLEKLGQVCAEAGNYDEAIGFYQRGREICEGVRKEKLADTFWTQNVSLFWRRIGDAYRQANKWDLAETAFRQAIDTLESATAQPGHAQREGELAASYERLAALKNAQQQFKEALEYAGRALAIRKKIRMADERDLVNLRNLLFLYHQLGDMYRKKDRWNDAVGAFEEGLKLCGEIEELGLVYSRAKDDRESFAAENQYTQDLKVALGDWDVLQGLPAKKKLEMLGTRSFELSQRGKYQLSVEAAQALIGQEAATGDQLFNASYDLCVAIKRREEEPALFVNGDSGGTLEDWRSSAMMGLQKAVERGYMDWETLRSEATFEPLRKLPAFEELFP